MQEKILQYFRILRSCRTLGEIPLTPLGKRLFLFAASKGRMQEALFYNSY